MTREKVDLQKVSRKWKKELRELELEYDTIRLY